MVEIFAKNTVDAIPATATTKLTRNEKQGTVFLDLFPDLRFFKKKYLNHHQEGLHSSKTKQV